MEFSHVGMITEEAKAGELFVEATRVWITNFVDHPHRVEWLRFEPDSPVTGPVRQQPHVAYRVDSIERASTDMQVLLEPFCAMENLRVGFYLSADGAVIELMEYDRSPFAHDTTKASRAKAAGKKRKKRKQEKKLKKAAASKEQKETKNKADKRRKKKRSK